MHKMEKSDLQELLCSLYLRLNGYFVSGFIIPAPEGDLNRNGKHRSVRGEIDILAVRFPYNKEPEREIEPSGYLHVTNEKIDILICEVKGRHKSLQFNKGLRENIENITSVLRWIGIFDEEHLNKETTHIFNMLSTQYPNQPDKFREYDIPFTNYRIRAIIFAPDGPKPSHASQQRYIYGEEIMNYIWRCFRPSKKRSLSQTRYDFGLWGPYEDIVRYFKNRESNDPGKIQDLYTYFDLK